MGGVGGIGREERRQGAMGRRLGLAECESILFAVTSHLQVCPCR